jgi:cytochrome c oxidase subunit 3
VSNVDAIQPGEHIEHRAPPEAAAPLRRHGAAGRGLGLGMWVFLVTEVMFFGGLFMAYLVYRRPRRKRSRKASHHLDIRWGAFNTAVLIFSSLTMALAVRAAQTNLSRKVQVGWLLATMFLGTVFLGVKVIEYADKFEHHIVPGPHFDKSAWTHPAGVEQFYSLYFIMTGCTPCTW